VGPTGVTGARGPTGPTGVMGPPGVTGPTGVIITEGESIASVKGPDDQMVPLNLGEGLVFNTNSEGVDITLSKGSAVVTIDVADIVVDGETITGKGNANDPFEVQIPELVSADSANALVLKDGKLFIDLSNILNRLDGLETSKQPLTNRNITFTSLPTALADTTTVAMLAPNFSGNIIAWTGTLTGTKFRYNATYSAVIELTPTQGYKFPTGLTPKDFTCTNAGVTITDYDENMQHLTVQFPKTASLIDPDEYELYITYEQPATPAATPRLDIPLPYFTDHTGKASELLTDDIWEAGYTEEIFPYECMVTYNVSGTDKIYPVPWSDFVADPNVSSGPNTIAAWEYSEGIISFFSYSNTTSEPVNMLIKSKNNPEPDLQPITSPTLTLPTPPVALANQSTVTVNGTNFTGTITAWSPTLTSSTFAYSTAYNAIIQLMPNENYEFAAGLAYTDFNVTGADAIAYNETLLQLTVQFAATGTDEDLYITYVQPSSPTATPKLDIPLSAFTDHIGNATELLTDGIWDASYTEETFPYECFVTYNVSGTDKIYQVPWSDFVADPNISNGPNTITAWEYIDGIISFFSYSNTTSEPLDIIIKSKES